MATARRTPPTLHPAASVLARPATHWRCCTTPARRSPARRPPTKRPPTTRPPRRRARTPTASRPQPW
eukprot:1139676-Prymnesium_polylepis.1